MFEYLEPVVNSPAVEQMLEDPSAVAGLATMGVVGTYVSFFGAGSLKAKHEIYQEEDEETIQDRGEELESFIGEDDIFKEMYNMVKHPYLSGKFSAYHKEDSSETEVLSPEEAEYFDQIYTDEDLEKLE